MLFALTFIVYISSPTGQTQIRQVSASGPTIVQSAYCYASMDSMTWTGGSTHASCNTPQFSHDFGTNPTGGDLLVVGATQLGSSDTMTISDSQSDTFHLLGSVSNGVGANAGIATLWYTIISSTAADTVTITTPNLDFIAGWLQEVSGFSTSAIYVSTGDGSGGCCKITPNIVVSGYSAAIVETQVTGVGTWTAASNYAKLYTNAGNEYSSQFEGSVTQSGSTSISTTMSTSTSNWNMVGATLYSCAELTVCSSSATNGQTNGNTVTPACSVFSASSSNTLIAIVGSIGSGQVFHAPTDTGSNTFTLVHTVTDGNLPTPESQVNVYSASVSSTLSSDTISALIDGTAGHGANFLSCYNIKTSTGTSLTYSDSSISTCQTNALCRSLIFSANDNAQGNLFINYVTEELGGAALAGCPNLLGFADASGVGGNINNIEAYQCLADPGAATNINVPIDNYGARDGRVCACTVPHYINNVTSGNTFTGTMAGVIIGVQEAVTTTTIEAWNVPDAPGLNSGTLFMVFLLVPTFLLLIIPIRSKHQESYVTFLLLGLIFSSALGGLVAGIPLALTAVFVGIFVIYLWKGKSRGVSVE